MSQETPVHIFSSALTKITATARCIPAELPYAVCIGVHAHQIIQSRGSHAHQQRPESVATLQCSRSSEACCLFGAMRTSTVYRFCNRQCACTCRQTRGPGCCCSPLRAEHCVMTFSSGTAHSKARLSSLEAGIDDEAPDVACEPWRGGKRHACMAPCH